MFTRQLRFARLTAFGGVLSALCLSCAAEDPEAFQEGKRSGPAAAAAGAAVGAREIAAGDAVDVVIDQAFLEARLKELSGVVPVTLGDRTVSIRERGSEDGRALARDWWRRQVEALGFSVHEQAYGGGFGGRGGINMIADKVGRDPARVLIVSAHYDSVGNAGADDDGSGIVSALAVAQALRDAPLGIGLRMIAFDQEEVGYLGSKAYARMLDETHALGQVAGVLNLEMTAYDADGDGHYHVIDCDENTSPDLTAVVDAAASRGALGLTKIAACTDHSDHASFWRYGVPAVAVSENFFGGDGNPCYHRACDKVDRLNWGFMRRVTEAVGRAAVELLRG